MALIHSLHEKILLPKDDPVISQLQKSLSKVCGSLAFASSSNAPFVPWRGDSSSVVSACSATQDLSLFKPHLKTSSSTTPSRRSPYSSSLVQRGSARQFFLTIFFAVIFFPFQTVVWQEGRFAPPEEVLLNPPHGEVVGSRALFLLGGWPLPGQLLVGLEGSGVTSWIVETLRVGFRIPFDRRSPLSGRLLSLPAGVLASAHQGSRLYPETSIPSSEGSSRISLSLSGLLQQSLPHPEGFGVVAPHHWLLTLNDYVTSSLSTWRLHSQSFVPFAQATGWSLWLCRTPISAILHKYGRLTHPGLFRTRH